MIPLSYSRSFCCELNVRYITSSLNFTLLGHLNRSSFSKDCELLGLYALHPFALSTLPIRLLFWTVIPVTENSPNLTILAGKRRREKKDQKLQSRTKLLRNLMETFIPWGIRSAFRRGGSPRITELTVTSGLYREISIIPFHHRDIFGCSSCGVAFCRTKGCKLFLLLDRYFVFISCVFKCIHSLRLFKSIWRGMWGSMLLISWEI